MDGDRRYNAEQLTSLVDGIINDGVFMGLGDALLVNALTGMDVVVGPGRAWFNSTWTHNDSDLPLTVEQSEILMNRIDAVVLEVNRTLSVRNNTIKIVKGTPGTVPVPPTLIKSELVNQYALAHIYVGAGVVEITASNITNKIGTNDCPFVTGILQTLNLTSLLTQWNSEFHDILTLRDGQFTNFLSASNTSFSDLLTAKESAFNSMLNARDTQFSEWMSMLQATLNENVATNIINMLVTHQDNTIEHTAHLGVTVNYGNAYEITSVKNIVDGSKFSVKFNAAATGAATLKISSDGTARNLVKSGVVFKPKALTYIFIRDGDDYQLLNEATIDDITNAIATHYAENASTAESGHVTLSNSTSSTSTTLAATSKAVKDAMDAAVKALVSNTSTGTKYTLHVDNQGLYLKEV